ncbi:LLM class flavin-dependent oxidoreductase [Pseudonocardia endophytica]|uniref:Methylenetetrahydromethanopterin reductase n=1 Tax=Pseudonocardia endophytica TaxID=401976 RepID=A0A4R1HLL0_PSEEN|nr:LLM class flavin-dependent oxidoreductase [Pseudonocardia endophytica]TCK21913.1 methylenetetrahydromethanopterin reductase [Pseudonocardia endophytica]
MLRRGIWFAGDVPTERMVELARKAEQAGLDSVWMADGYYARDPLVSLAAVGAATERVLLGTSVLNPYTRHPAALAMAFATLDELSGGRAVIGIGSGAQHQVADQMGYDGSRPLTAVREAIDVLEQMATGHEVRYDGKVITARGPRLVIRGARQLPIYVGAVGPKMLQLAGRRGAGAFVPQTSPEFVRAAVKDVAKGAADAGRDPRDVDIAAMIVLAVADDEADAQRTVGPLLGILMLAPEAERILQGNGLDPGIADRLRAAFAAGGVREVARTVTPEMIDKLAIAGPPDLCRAKLQELVDAGVTHPVVSMLGRSSEAGFEVLNAIEERG